MKQATVIYISPLQSADYKYNLAFNLMSDESDYSDKYFKWPLDIGESITYHSEETKTTSDNVKLISVGRIKDASFHEWEWGKTTSEKRFGEKLRAWSKDAKEYRVTLYCPIKEPDTGIRLNELHEAAEYGITYNQQGILIWGNGEQANTYYLNCYIRSSVNKYIEGWRGYTQNELLFYSPIPWWQKIIGVNNFEPIDVGSLHYDNIKDYEDYYDYYPYDYLPSAYANYEVNNTNYIGSRYIAYIYGPTNGPVIDIIDSKNASPVHIGFSNVEVPSNATLVVNSIDKTAYIYNPDDSMTNVFGDRDSDYAGQLWNRILGGKITITTSGGFYFRIDLVEERSEPKWPTV